MPPRSEPAERMCIVTREVQPTGGLIRFVLDPEGRVVADLKHRLPGRGVWVTASRRQVAEAVRRKLFARAFGESVSVDEDLAEAIDRRLTDLVLGSLGLARKAGAAISGATKVESAIAAGKAIAVLNAIEAAPDGVRKIEAARRRSGSAIPAFQCFTTGQLDLALGGSNVIHAALLAGRSGEDVLKRLEALLRYRTEDASAHGGADAPTGTQPVESGTDW